MLVVGGRREVAVLVCSFLFTNGPSSSRPLLPTVGRVWVMRTWRLGLEWAQVKVNNKLGTVVWSNGPYYP